MKLESQREGAFFCGIVLFNLGSYSDLLEADTRCVCWRNSCPSDYLVVYLYGHSFVDFEKMEEFC